MNKLLVLFIGIAAISCSSPTVQETTETTDEQHSVIVSLTDEQYASVGLKTAKPDLNYISGSIEATGMLDVPPQQAISVMALFGGYVKSTDMLQGKQVKKGDVLCVMQNPSYIQLQQEYLDIKSQLEFLQADFERQKQLAAEQVNSPKTFQQAKAQYESAKAKLNGIKAQLLMLNVPLNTLDAGVISPTVNITSPINGYITEMKINLGSYVQPQDLLFRIIDPEHLHAELQVFEKDIPYISKNQKVHIRLVNEQKIRTAHVYLINKEISAERTVRVHCHLDVEDQSLIPGTYLHAQVFNDAQKHYTLPESAVVSYNGRQYVFSVTAKKLEYEMIPVNLLLTKDKSCVVNPLDTSKRYVVQGAYDLLSKVNNKSDD